MTQYSISGHDTRSLAQLHAAGGFWGTTGVVQSGGLARAITRAGPLPALPGTLTSYSLHGPDRGDTWMTLRASNQTNSQEWRCDLKSFLQRNHEEKMIVITKRRSGVVFETGLYVAIDELWPSWLAIVNDSGARVSLIRYGEVTWKYNSKSRCRQECSFRTARGHCAGHREPGAGILQGRPLSHAP